MFTTYVAVTILAAAANAAAAGFDFARHPQVLANMTMLGIPRSWLFPLGALKAAGALGLLVGIGVPLLGVAAAVGLVLFSSARSSPTSTPARRRGRTPTRQRFCCWPWAR